MGRMNRRGFFKLAASLLALPVVKPIMDVLPEPVRDNTSLWMVYWNENGPYALVPKGTPPPFMGGLTIPKRPWFTLKGGE
jgi:hypothetical protein